MKRLPLRIAVALLTFVVGNAVSGIRAAFFVASPDCSYSPASSLDEEWHRLYEASRLSGDAVMMKEVSDRLLCRNVAGVPDALPIEIEGALWCQRDDRSIHSVLMNDTNYYGSYFWRISSSHSKWSLENMEFVRRVSNGKKAREYVATHRIFYTSEPSLHFGRLP